MTMTLEFGMFFGPPVFAFLIAVYEGTNKIFSNSLFCKLNLLSKNHTGHLSLFTYGNKEPRILKKIWLSYL